MPKTINWPEKFETEILNEEDDSVKLAIRPGRLYFDTNYYHLGDVVDVRIDNKVVRKALINEELKLSKIKDLKSEDFKLLKNSLKTQNDVIQFLSKKYDLCIDENSDITLITYRNLELTALEENEDPHFC